MVYEVTLVLLSFGRKMKNVVSFWQCSFHCYQSMSKCCNFQARSCRRNQTDRKNERYSAGFQNYEVEENSASCHNGKGIYTSCFELFVDMLKLHYQYVLIARQLSNSIHGLLITRRWVVNFMWNCWCLSQEDELFSLKEWNQYIFICFIGYKMVWGS